MSGQSRFCLISGIHATTSVFYCIFVRKYIPYKSILFMDKVSKTNAARLLDKAKVDYDLIPYKVDPDNLAAEHVAEELGEDINSVFKTLVLHGDKAGYFVCVVPGNMEVDLKKAAKVAGSKKAELIPMKELLPLTGYIRGGCSPIGMKKAFPTYFHLTVSGFEFVYVSAGVRGLQFKIRPADLVAFCKATVADIAEEKV